MSDLISRNMAITHVNAVLFPKINTAKEAEKALRQLPTIDAVEVVRCKDCIHQQKVFHEDKRIKEGGYYICGCELADGYSVVCLDGDFCSRGKRKGERE